MLSKRPFFFLFSFSGKKTNKQKNPPKKSRDRAMAPPIAKKSGATDAHYSALSPVTFSGPDVVRRHIESLMDDAIRMVRTCERLSDCALRREDLSRGDAGAAVANPSTAGDEPLAVMQILDAVRRGFIDGTLVHTGRKVAGPHTFGTASSP
jgi:hypothetical protein